MKTTLTILALLLASNAYAESPAHPLWKPFPAPEAAPDERPIEYMRETGLVKPTPRKPIGVSTPFTLGEPQPPPRLTGPSLQLWSIRQRCWPNCQ